MGFRYHVATIAAIFFALTVGLVVGSFYVSPQLADSQRKAIVALRETMNREVVTQKDQIKEYQEFIAQVTPSLLRGRLAKVPVALIVTGDYPEALASVRDALKLAEANIVTVTKIEPAFNRPDELLKSALASLHAADTRIPTDRDALARLLAGLLTRGETPPEGLLDLLNRENLVQVEPEPDFTLVPRYVLVVAGSRSEVSNRVNYVDKPLISALQGLGATVVASEPTPTAASSDAQLYRALNLDVRIISNVETEMGRCALILALRGDRPESQKDAADPRSASNGAPVRANSSVNAGGVSNVGSDSNSPSLRANSPNAR